ncbi:MAG: cytidine deaminase [Paludibacteraceae bacterium]|nr:cytidine deaminase [Paludibacteraceae bacterium]
MEERKIVTSLFVYAYDELPADYKRLVDEAKRVTKDAYAPYSKFHVGAALLLANGEIVSATNQENAAYPSGMCAERVTMFYANSRYPNLPPKALAIASFAEGDFLDEPITPCGACRQVLLEAEMRYGADINVLLYGKRGVYVVSSVKALLPLSFDSSLLK